MEYKVITTSDNTNYYLTSNLKVAGPYAVSMTVMKIGQLRMIIYKNTDFTGYVADLALPSFIINFNTALNGFFG